MPKYNPDYSKTVIYKLINYDHPDLVYVGSTTNFVKRKNHHKSMINTNSQRKIYKTIQDHGGWDSWHMIKICDYPCNTSLEARQAEDKHMMELKAGLNTYKPYTSDEEKKERKKRDDRRYQISHKEKINEYRKNYRELNKESINKKASEKVKCDCGCIVRKDKLTNHKKTKKHINLTTNSENSQ